MTVGEFFCSFGLYDYPAIKAQLEKSCDIIYCNPKQAQHQFLTSCGLWSLWFCFLFSRGVHLQTIIPTFFSSKTYLNDIVVTQIVTQLMKFPHKGIENLLLSEEFFPKEKKVDEP